MCGVIGIVANSEAVGEIYDGLATLQHRGQDAAGVMVFDGNQFHTKRGSGLVRDVITAADIPGLRGKIGIGHVRYPTTGSYSADEVQPFFVNSPLGLGLVQVLVTLTELGDHSMMSCRGSLSWCGSCRPSGCYLTQKRRPFFCISIR